ncbi:MAG: DUF2089 domain-containing protein, partial [Chloroflexi bacterium]|nr:DUF2089 domain-containing protein [Chloroflexota bacterium]
MATHPLPTQCPLCGGPVVVTRLRCERCDITIEGRFTPYLASPLARLTPEQLRFVEAFLRAEGKFSRLEKELGLSYPTLRNRLREILRAMGFRPADDPRPKTRRPTPEERQRIL